MFAVHDLLKSARGSALAVAAALLLATSAQAQSDLLPSWNDTGPKAAIVAFVEKVTKANTSDFVPEPERIAVFGRVGSSLQTSDE